MAKLLSLEPLVDSSQDVPPEEIENPLAPPVQINSERPDPATEPHQAPVSPISEVHSPIPTLEIPAVPNISQEETTNEPPSTHIRHSKYPLRFREPKRQ